MLKKYYKLLLISLTFFAVSNIYAQCPPGYCQNPAGRCHRCGPPPPPANPIDMGVGALLALGVGFGIKKLRSKK